MATPNLTYQASRTTSSGTTFTPTLPSGTGRVFVPVSCPSNTALTTSSTDWFVYKVVPNGTGLQCTWFVSRESAGASPGALVVTSAASTLFSTVAIRSDLVRTRIVFGASVIGTAANANPGFVDHLLSRATRYVEVLTLNGTGVASAASSGYSGLTTQAGFTGGASTCVASKSATSQSDDPGAWTHSSAAYIAQTVALLDAGTAWDDDWKPAAQNLVANGVNIAVNFWGDSLTSGATHATTGMSSNQHATARPALFAANLTAANASAKTWIGCGGANVTSSQLNSYDNRRTAGTNWDTSRNSGLNSIGGGLLTCTSGTAVFGFAPGGSWDRHRVLKAQYSGSPQYTTRVDAGSTTTLTMNTTPSAITWQAAVTGSGTTINIAATGAGGYIAACEAYTNGVPQISVFNAGWFGSTSTQNAEIANFYSPPYVAAALSAKLTVICIGSNDPGAGVTTDQTEYNIQLMSLVGLITGSVVIETPPFASGGTEAAQDALFDKIEAIADALCVGFFRISDETGWTSYATASSNGYMTSGDNHPTTAGYADWSTRELAYIDPGPLAQSLTAGLLTNTSTLYAPTVTTSTALSPGLLTNTSSFFAPTVTPGAVTLSPGLLTNTSTLYDPTVSQAGGGAQNLDPPLLTNTSSFYAPTVTPGAVTLTPGLLTNANNFHAPTVSPGPVTLDPGLLTNTSSFFAPTVSPGAVTLSPALLTNTSTFYAATVSPGAVTLSPGLLSNAQTFYAPTVSQGGATQTLTPGLLTNSSTFYAPTVTPGAVVLSAGLLTNTEVFYGPTVSQPGGAQVLSPSLLTNVSVFYPPAANQNDPPGTYPLALEGGGTVFVEVIDGIPTIVGGSINFTGSVVAGALRGRP